MNANALAGATSPAAISDGLNRGAAWGAGALVLLGAFATVAFFVLDEANGGLRSAGDAVLITTAFIAFSLVGGLIAARVPRNATGWLMLAVGAGAMAMNAAQAYATYALETNPESLPGALPVAWLANWGYYAVLSNVLFLMLVFPTGRPASSFWRLVLWIDVAIVAVVVASLAFGPRPLEGLDVANPVRIDPLTRLLRAIDEAGGWVMLVVLATCLFAPIARARRARGVERQQLKWLALGASIFAVCFGLIAPLFDVALGIDVGTPSWAIGLVALPTTIGVAILGYRLYELNFIVNRSLVYFVLTACVVAIYVGLVALLGAAIGRTGGALIATGAVALAFQPLQRYVQRAINRLMYGERDEPYAVLSRLAARLASSVPVEQTLTTITETVTGALRVPYAAIELRRNHGYLLSASSGEPEEAMLTLPLVHRGEEIGRLLVSGRSPGAAFSSADRRLLEDLALQAGATAYTVRLLSELQGSRERLVGALEEERRRIRRDLHDGLGPSLAGAMLELEAARNLVGHEPERAAELLDELTGKVQSAISDIRRLVYGLRPPALDELGLIGAVREQAARFESGSLQIRVSDDGNLALLPAAIEVAAYRIAVEAMTNAARHSQAMRCDVAIAANGSLTVEVRDDGVGMSARPRFGVGLTSMRERAEELGGRVELRTAPGGGTVVRAEIPIAR
ncbi:MAG: sensor histidine kinase [Actinomycetota bacterium]